MAIWPQHSPFPEWSFCLPSVRAALSILVSLHSRPQLASPAPPPSWRKSSGVAAHPPAVLSTSQLASPAPPQFRGRRPGPGVSVRPPVPAPQGWRSGAADSARDTSAQEGRWLPPNCHVLSSEQCIQTRAERKTNELICKHVHVMTVQVLTRVIRLVKPSMCYQPCSLSLHYFTHSPWMLIEKAPSVWQSQQVALPFPPH